MPDIWMDVDTALSEVPVNVFPLTDDTDFKTIEDSVAYNAAGMDLRWNFVTTAGVYTSTAVTPTTSGDYDWAHQGDGMYSIEMPASSGASINNDAEGFGWFSGKATGVLPWRGPVIGFRAAAINNAMIDGGDSLDVNATQIGGQAVGLSSDNRLRVDVAEWNDIPLSTTNPLPNAAASAANGLFTRGTGAGQINQSANGQIDVNVERLGNVAQSLTDLKDFADEGYDPATNKVQGVVLVDTTTTLTNDPAGVTTLLSRLSAARAGYLDNLNVGGVVASQADIDAINQSASRRVILTSVQQYERPESGSTVYTIEARTYDGDGAATNADSTPTLSVTGATSGDLSGNLGAATNPATGLYRWTYTVDSVDTIEPLRVDISATISSSVFTLSFHGQVVDFVAATWTSNDASNLTAIFNKLPSKDYLAGTANADGDIELNEATGSLAASHFAASALDGKGDWNVGKTGYSLVATTGLGNQTANITGNLSGSVGSVTGNVSGSVGSLATQAKADVNAEVADVLTVDTHAEPAAVVAATSSLKDKINWIFSLLRNKRTQTSSTETLFADDGTTPVATSSKADDGTTATRGEWT